MAAKAEINVATEKPASREGQRRQRPDRRRRLQAGHAKHASGNDALRGELVTAPAQRGSDGTKRPADMERTSLCSNLPGPWRFRDTDGTIICSERLIEQNLNLARKYAWNWSKKSAFDYQELEALAYLGLIKGIRKFDPRKGFKLSTICVPYVNGEILHFFRDKGYAIKYPSRWREVMPKARKSLEAGHDPAVISDELGMTLAELEEMLGSMCGTSELRDEVVGEGEHDVELDLLRPLEGLAIMAWERMSWADKTFIVNWWKANRRRAPRPQPQLASFDRLTLHLLEGRPLPEVRKDIIRKQLELGLVGKLSKPLPAGQSTSRRRRPSGRKKAALDAVVWQMIPGLMLDSEPTILSAHPAKESHPAIQMPEDPMPNVPELEQRPKQEKLQSGNSPRLQSKQKPNGSKPKSERKPSRKDSATWPSSSHTTSFRETTAEIKSSELTMVQRQTSKPTPIPLSA